MANLNDARIGGSDAPTILQLNPYRSPVETWARLALGVKSEIPPGSMERVDWGNRLERPVFDAWLDRFEPGRAADWRAGISREPDDPNWVRYTVDFERPGALMEVKTTSAYSRGQWGMPGTDEIPINYQIQIHWYLYHERCRLRALKDPNWPPPERCYVAVLIGGQEMLGYVIEADDEFGSEIFQRVGAWHAAYVLTSTPPPADASPGCREYLAGRFRKVAPTIRPAKSDEAIALAGWLELTQKKTALVKELGLAENLIIESIASDSGIEAAVEELTIPGYATDRKGGPVIRATYKRPNPSTKIDWKTARSAFEREFGADRVDEIISAHTTHTNPSRRLSIRTMK